MINTESIVLTVNIIEQDIFAVCYHSTKTNEMFEMVANLWLLIGLNLNSH